ncbi:response regulator transcription factor [Cohnella herbarum]|uniref:Response regulator n=1 Tax=Cohnella herbarum TaxID=2728023 RepID=A0A7Z2VLJ0_9BACL|nr:helix-turn-helix domain-containing protein [Cohnella herbarum]QJD85020.1 response regulator [Cohnella herbarum]
MTYRMLIVDDELHAIEGVKADLDLEKLEIEGLFTAFNIRQAKDILTCESIDILLCDIEMPLGSGLELLSWVRVHHPSTITIFLTSHADFKYAKEALQLGCLDYLLKPVLTSDLEAVIRRAQNLIEQQSEMNRNSQSHRLWMRHHSLIIERFWLDLINHTTPNDPVAIYEQVERQQIPITENSIFLPILISVKHWRETLKPRDAKILEYALKKTAEEMLIENREGIVFQLDRDQLLILFFSDNWRQWDYGQLQDQSRKYIHFCNRHFYCALSCYFGQPVKAHCVADKVGFLKTKDRNNVAYFNQVFGEDGTMQSDQSIILPDLNLWLSLLKKGTNEAVVQGMDIVLDDLIKHSKLDARILHQLHQDFLQALYSYLNMNELQAHQLFGDEESKRLSETAGRSVNDMMNWVRHAVDKALHQTEVIRESESVVQNIKRYVATNIDQDLSREKMAEQVFLNPDHLSKLFKKETGYSLSDYVLSERIKLAKELLSQTRIPISAVASSVGYTNFSHFTKIFRKYAEMGPSEYRSQYGQEVQ